MASWLASQLKAAETLLEAVDRTVSSATVPAGQATRPLEPGSPKQPIASGEGYSLTQNTTGPFSASQQTVSSPSFVSPSYQRLQPRPASNSLASTDGSPLPAGMATTAVSGPPPPMFQPRPWQPGSPAVGQSHVSFPAADGPPPPIDFTALPQPSSTGSYTVRQHGPFSPSPVEQKLMPSVQPPAAAESSTAPPDAAAAAAVPEPGAVPWESQVAGELQNVPSGGAGSARPAAAVGSGPRSRLDLQTSTGDEANTLGSSGAEQAGILGINSGPGADESIATVQQAMHEERGSDSSTAHAAVVPPSNEQQPTIAEPAIDAGVPMVPAVVVLAATAPAEATAPASSATSAAAADATASIAPDSNALSVQQQGFPTAAAAAAISAAIAAAASEQEQQHQTFAPVEQQPLQIMPDRSPASSSFGPPPPLATPAAAAAPRSTHSTGGDDDAFSASSAASVSGGTSGKEAQLTRLVETLRKRLDRIKSENQQLEDLLHSTEQRTAAEQQRAEQLAAEVAAMHRAQDDLITSAAANAAAQDARIARLQQDLEASKRQVTALQDALEAIQEQHQQVLSSKDSIEGGALEALRSELLKAETQLEAERKAHASTKSAATARERDLEEQLGSSSEALAATQRQFQDLASRSRDLEEQHALAAAEAARLQQQLQELEGQHVTAQQPDPAVQLRLEAEKEALGVQLVETQGALLAAHQAQHAAEAQAAHLQQELVQLQNNIQASAARGPPQLEHQVSELQELLYQKQQQLERLSGEKQGQLMMLERQVNMLRQELGKAHAAAAAANTSSSGRIPHDIIPMDALGEPYQRLARHRKLGGAVQATANFLDTTAATATQLLRQQPLARLAVFVYLILIHLYVYFLLARMQRQALMLLTAQDKSAAVDLAGQLQEPGPGSLPH